MGPMQKFKGPATKRRRTHADASSSSSAPQDYGVSEDATSDKHSVLKEPPPPHSSTQQIDQRGSPPEGSTPAIEPRRRPPPQVSTQVIEARGRPPPRSRTPRGRPLLQFSRQIIEPRARPPPQVDIEAGVRPPSGDFASEWNFNIGTPGLPLEDFPNVPAELPILDALPPEHKITPEGFGKLFECIIQHRATPMVG